MAGYSQRRLVDKLGIKPGNRVAIINAPQDYDELLGTLPEGVQVRTRLTGHFDFIQFFTKGRRDLAKRFGSLMSRMDKNGMLWVSWPKRASGVETDVNEDIVRDVALGAGLVDVKVCAVDDVWSGLKLVYRKKDR